jgi:hypothetical protein
MLGRNQGDYIRAWYIYVASVVQDLHKFGNKIRNNIILPLLLVNQREVYHMGAWIRVVEFRGVTRALFSKVDMGS